MQLLGTINWECVFKNDSIPLSIRSSGSYRQIRELQILQSNAVSKFIQVSYKIHVWKRLTPFFISTVPMYLVLMDEVIKVLVFIILPSKRNLKLWCAFSYLLKNILIQKYCEKSHGLENLPNWEKTTTISFAWCNMSSYLWIK